MSFVDTRTLADGSRIESDIAIIGAGPAGIALALAFAGKGVRVAVLESGGFEFDEQTQQLAAGKIAGLPYLELEHARLRLLGGSSGHWAGNVRPLDPIDFEQRPWLPHSGWPFGITELEPYYDQAREFCGLPEQAFDRAHWAKVNGGEPWKFVHGAVASKVFHTLASPTLRFGTSYRDRLDEAAGVTTYLYANVVEIETDGQAANVTGLRVRSLSGKRISARARSYVLASGGIENARLLLLSSRTQAAGLGNAHDLVGRFFMDHLTFPGFAEFYPSDRALPLGFYLGSQAEWGASWGMLQLSETIERRENLLSSRFQLATVINEFNKNMRKEGMQSLREVFKQRAQVDDFGRHIANIIADIDDLASSAYYRLFHHPDYPLIKIGVVTIAEQAPNPQSRVYLGEDTDSLGQRRAVLDWRVTELDYANVKKSADVLARELGRSGLGRLMQLLPVGGERAANPRPHYHHMGTTRMHVDPRRGVVDAHSRVHGISNLYMAGSSVFPTAGNVNPTYTILALAYRLADHVTGELAHG